MDVSQLLDLDDLEELFGQGGDIGSGSAEGGQGGATPTTTTSTTTTTTTTTTSTTTTTDATTTSTKEDLFSVVSPPPPLCLPSSPPSARPLEVEPAVVGLRPASLSLLSLVSTSSSSSSASASYPHLPLTATTPSATTNTTTTAIPLEVHSTIDESLFLGKEQMPLEMMSMEAPSWEVPSTVVPIPTLITPTPTPIDDPISNEEAQQSDKEVTRIAIEPAVRELLPPPQPTTQDPPPPSYRPDPSPQKPMLRRVPSRLRSPAKTRSAFTASASLQLLPLPTATANVPATTCMLDMGSMQPVPPMHRIGRPLSFASAAGENLQSDQEQQQNRALTGLEEKLQSTRTTTTTAPSVPCSQAPSPSGASLQRSQSLIRRSMLPRAQGSSPVKVTSQSTLPANTSTNQNNNNNNNNHVLTKLPVPLSRSRSLLVKRPTGTTGTTGMTGTTGTTGMTGTTGNGAAPSAVSSATTTTAAASTPTTPTRSSKWGSFRLGSFRKGDSSNSNTPSPHLHRAETNGSAGASGIVLDAAKGGFGRRLFGIGSSSSGGGGGGGGGGPRTLGRSMSFKRSSSLASRQ